MPGDEVLHSSDIPRILSVNEEARYERIFALDTRGAFTEANREIARLQDRLLLGEVLAARYLGPVYRPSYAELADWLAVYGDEPDAPHIRALANSRRPDGAPAPALAKAQASATTDGDTDTTGLSPQAALLDRQVRQLAASAPKRAEALLASADAKRLLDDDSRDALRAVIAEAYLGNDDAQDAQDALRLSTQHAGGRFNAQAHWEAGLAAWRLGRLGEAAQDFEQIARVSSATSWLRSAAAFWAARVAGRERRWDAENYWLGIAAAEPRSFYGLIARRALGQAPALDFAAEPFTEIDVDALSSIEAGRRALALIAVGQRARAAAELRTIAQRDSRILLPSLAGLADRAGLAGVSMQLAGALADVDGRQHDRALYPVPRWMPQGGFAIDRALIFALMRQESLFAPRATSTAGAQGVMQLMPETARAMAERTGTALPDKTPDKALADPDTNVTLAQEYVRMLLGDARIADNLVLFTLAYNGGPSGLAHWGKLAAKYHDDPLLFLESVPSHQGRVFTKHVLTNYWIYRTRLDQATPDLDALAANQWPTYIAEDQSPRGEVRYAAN